jgi:putative transposase
MVQMARNAVDAIDSPLLPIRFVLHDRDAKFCAPFRSLLQSSGVEPIRLPPRSPNLNAFAALCPLYKAECLSHRILFGEVSLRRAINEYLPH